MEHLHLRKFDMSTIANDSVVVMLGKRNTGKSFLVRDLLYYHRDIPIGTVVSATECANNFYSQMIPNIFIHESPDPEIVAKALKRQARLQQQIKKAIRRSGKSDIDMRAFLVLDDCLADKHKWINHPAIHQVFLNGRHYKLLTLITIQYPMGIPPILRGNIDYVFVLRDNVMGNRKKIYDNYCGMFRSFDMFNQVMEQTTSNYECLVVNNNVKSNKLEDQVFWYKAQKHDAFKIGAQYFWDLCASSDDDNNDNDVDEEENAIRRVSKGPVVSVIKG